MTTYLINRSFAGTCGSQLKKTFSKGELTSLSPAEAAEFLELGWLEVVEGEESSGEGEGSVTEVVEIPTSPVKKKRKTTNKSKK